MFSGCNTAQAIAEYGVHAPRGNVNTVASRVMYAGTDSMHREQSIESSSRGVSRVSGSKEKDAEATNLHLTQIDEFHSVYTC